jgi:hypothetical protein
MVGIPQLRGDKEILPRDSASCESCLQCFTYLSFIPISLGAIKCRNPAAGALVARLVSAASGSTCKARAGIFPPPRLSQAYFQSEVQGKDSMSFCLRVYAQCVHNQKVSRLDCQLPSPEEVREDQ